MKTIFRFCTPVLAVAAAVCLQACGWGVNGLDRMEEVYPTDAVADVADVIDDAVDTDTVEADIAQDIPVADVNGDVTDEVTGEDANVWPDVSYEGLTGSWAVRLVSNGVMTVPMVGERPMKTTDLFLAEATESGIEMTFCDEIIAVEPTEDFNTTTTTKAALRQALAETLIPLAVTGNAVDAQEIVWEWALADTIGDNDPLPAADKDNAEVNFQNYPDIDDDSHPGVTITVSLNLWGSPTVGERYMGKRVKFDLSEGAMSGDGRWITGDMTFAVDERVLGADQVLLNNGAAVAPSTDGTLYQFRRIDQDFDCAKLVEVQAGLFSEAP